LDRGECVKNGSYSGWIKVGGEELDVAPDQWWGTRDRSWGIRPVGAQDPQQAAPEVIPQFYWLWAPANFDDCIALYDVNTDGEGKIWHTQGIIAPLTNDIPEIMKEARSEVRLKSGTRHAESAKITFRTQGDEEIGIHVEPLYQFYMSGIGYMHPEWGHGLNKGELAVGYDTIDLATVDEAAPLSLHVQAISKFVMNDKIGMGVLEQLIIGPHAPSGLKDLFDMAP